MSILAFPDPVVRYAEELRDALEPVLAICREAAERLTREQRMELDGQAVILTTDATAPLTAGFFWEEQREIVRAVIDAHDGRNDL